MNVRVRLAELLVSGLCLLQSTGSFCQDELQARFFKLNLPNIDQIGNASMDKISSGIANIILALNDGRQQNLPVDPKRAESARVELEGAREGLYTVLKQVPLKKISVEVIHASQYAQAYDDLVALLAKAKLPEPVDSMSLIKLLVIVIDSCENDLRTLTLNSKGSGGQDQVVKAFLDLVQKKAILEHLGATSGIITIAMQG